MRGWVVEVSVLTFTAAPAVTMALAPLVCTRNCVLDGTGTPGKEKLPSAAVTCGLPTCANLAV